MEQLKEIITQAIPGSQVEIFDPMQDGKHLEAVVISDQFEGLSMIAQHRLVMNCLKEKFATSLHALSLKTYTPDQWERENV